MKAVVRRKMEMGTRVLGFLRAHPFSDPSHLALVQGLEEHLARLRTLAIEEQSGRRDARAANAWRRQLRGATLRTLVRVLERVGEAAGTRHPELTGRYKGPGPNASNAAFLARGWDLLQRARADLEVLSGFGLTGDLLDELATLLTRYEEATVKSQASQRQHVGARAGLEAIGQRVTQLIGVLDALVRNRFAASPERLAAWESARSMAWPRSATSAEPTPPPSPTPAPDLGRAA